MSEEAVKYESVYIVSSPETSKAGDNTEVDGTCVERFKKITDEMVETYKAKNATYGNAYLDGFRRFGAVQLVSRIYEKYCRIENLLIHNADNEAPDENVVDTLTDMANQCVILRTLIESPVREIKWDR